MRYFGEEDLAERAPGFVHLISISFVQFLTPFPLIQYDCFYDFRCVIYHEQLYSF